MVLISINKIYFELKYVYSNLKVKNRNNRKLSGQLNNII